MPTQYLGNRCPQWWRESGCRAHYRVASDAFGGIPPLRIMFWYLFVYAGHVPFSLVSKLPLTVVNSEGVVL